MKETKTKKLMSGKSCPSLW